MEQGGGWLPPGMAGVPGSASKTKEKGLQRLKPRAMRIARLGKGLGLNQVKGIQRFAAMASDALAVEDFRDVARSKTPTMSEMWVSQGTRTGID